MILTRLLFLATFFTISLHSHASTGIFIGNGGEGVETGDRLFVKDLFLVHAHRNPYFGEDIDPQLPELPDETTIDFSYPRELLARKLTDLNRALPGLGDYVLAAMKVYHWKLQDLPLRKILEPEQIVAYPVWIQQIQIANRFQSLIRIDRKAYSRLDDANRVALLLHEAVYSLVRPFPAGDGRLYQSVHVVRDLIGLFFQLEFFKISELQALLKVSPALNIPHLVIPLLDLRKSPTWQISAIDGVESDNAFKTVERVWRYPAFAKNMKQIDNSIRFICEQVRRRAKDGRLFDLKVEFDTRPAVIRTDFYMPPGNLAISQMSVRFEPLLGKDRLTVRFTSNKDINQCESTIRAKKEHLIQEFTWLP